MGILRWLFGGSETAGFAPGRGWTTEVVGESNYQDNLRALHRSYGGTEHDVKAVTELIPEASNKHDSKAVRVEIDRMKVGYLSREMAAQYRDSVGNVSGKCSSKIVGGYAMDDGSTAHFGVKLNMSWPPRFKAKR